MQLIDTGRTIQYIDVSAELTPTTFLIKLVDKTYRLTFRYNPRGQFFTVDLGLDSSGDTLPLVYGEVLRYGKPLFEAYNDERYPLPVICPLCLTGDQIDDITYDNFGNAVKLYIFDRPAEG